jgi:single-strand DNA-binding protein
MSGVNRCIFIGNLTRSVEVRYTKSGQAVASFAIACNETYKDKDGNKQENVEFVNITAWGKLGEICGEYLEKGKQVYVEGKMKTDKYEKDGVERYSTKIVISNMTMLGQAGSGSGSGHGGGNSSDGGTRGSSGGSQGSSSGGSDDFEDDDIPF